MTATSTGMTRIKSFPFDSKADGYDSSGYPVYDRAVGSDLLRLTYEKFFTDGIFPNPGTALQIGKGTSGLTVTIQPGIGIINGAMGGVMGDDPITITLDTAAPQGNVAYGIMLRYDNTDSFSDSRSLLINVVRGDASSSPKPPDPDTTTPEVYELRLGYVIVPSGATDLSAAQVVNEKGSSVCPYAAPFEEVDLSQVVADAQNQAQEATDAFLVYVKKYYDLVASSIDGTTAGELQSQIDAITPANFVDNVTISQTSAGKMQVKDGGVNTEKIANGAVTESKLSSGIIAMIKPATGKDLGAYTWEELSELAHADSTSASDLKYLIGQTKGIYITGYGTFSAQLIGIGHDTPVSGDDSKTLTFQMVEIVTNQPMTSGGFSSWASSYMRSFLNGDFLSALPQNLTDLILEVKKPYCSSQGGSVQYSNDKIWVASWVEVSGDSYYCSDGEQYEYWASNNANAKRVKELSGKTEEWWTRTPYSTSSFIMVGTSGSSEVASSPTGKTTGCVPCFCI